MSAKSMFYRLFRIPQKPDISTWNIEMNNETPPIPHGDAAILPMKTWDATTEGVQALTEEEPPPVIRKATDREDSMDVVIMRWLPTDAEVTGWACRNLRRLSPEALAAGLRAYVQQHPATA